MNSVYLSARFERRDELNQYRLELEALGLKVTSRWLETDPPPGRRLTEEEWQALAAVDCEDVQRATWFIGFSDPPELRHGMARHVEYGMAVALGRRVIVVGEREHIFHRLPDVAVVEDWGEALRLLLNDEAFALAAASEASH